MCGLGKAFLLLHGGKQRNQMILNILTAKK
jgi:hypothetical protein